MHYVEAVIPYDEGEFLSIIRRVGIVLNEVDFVVLKFLQLAKFNIYFFWGSWFPLILKEYTETGMLVQARVPPSMASQIQQYNLKTEVDIARIPGKERIIEIDL